MFEIRVPVGSGLVGDCFLLADCQLLILSSHARKRERGLSECTNPILEGFLKVLFVQKKSNTMIKRLFCVG